ncbi:Wzz/FepE/Etk N-terminal domain-containing protein [Hazenella coriacea]|uniref:Subunit length determinant protein n=1 Tax=Hazenella coriacea TaxID=1179467 RepID=A0A4R3L114_9BACL|nr:Wzz/FepE/Etk N-terminal domain-containing protein [Hazenella coriacea]TCS93253.1 subunit length determinant protein [Hazenella coriacea]
MSNEQLQEENRYIFFEYLLFFWKRKKIFLLIPVVFVIGALLFGLLQPSVYTGQAVVAVGSITTDSLINPDIIQGSYKKELDPKIKSSFQAVVPKSGQVRLQVTGGDQEVVQKNIEKVSNAYLGSLQALYTNRSDMYKKQIEGLNKRIEELSKATEFYRSKVDKNPADIVTGELLIENEKELSRAQDSAQVINIDLLYLEAPSYTIEPTVTKQRSPIVSNLAVALALSFVVMILVLVFWKYIDDAKKHYPSLKE